MPTPSTTNGAAPQLTPPPEELITRLRDDAEHWRSRAKIIREGADEEIARLLRFAAYYEALADRESADPTKLPILPPGQLSGPAPGEYALTAAVGTDPGGGAPWR